MKPILAVLALIILASLVGTLIGRSTRPASSFAATTTTTRQAQIDAGLDRIVPQIRFDKTPLDKAVDTLRETTHLNFDVRWKVLEAAGIDNETPITVKLNDVPLRQVLDYLCEEVAGGTVKFRARADRGVIVISTDEDLSKDTELRVYDVRDLLIADTQFMNPAPSQPQSTTAPAGSTGAPVPPNEPYQQSIDRLRQVLVDNVATDSWRDSGGTVGSIQDFDGLFIITTTPEYQQQIGDLLEKIRSRGR
jgi:hypothetical protein